MNFLATVASVSFLILATAGPPDFSELGIVGLVLVLLAWLANSYITKKASTPPPLAITTEEILKVIRSSTDIQARLVTQIETQNKVVSDLVVAVNRLLGRLQ